MKKYSYKPQTLYAEDKISYYLLGAFMSDGCVPTVKRNSKITFPRIQLTSIDYDWLTSIGNLLCDNIRICNNKTNNVKYISIYSKEIVKWFISKGYTPAKSLTLEFPKIPDKYIWDFVRGYIDGDGSIGIYEYKDKKTQRIRKNKRVSLISGSKLFIIQFNKLLNDNNIKYNFLVDTRKKNLCYRTNINGKHAFKLLSLMYHSDDIICLQRKAILANKIIDYYQYEYKKERENLSGRISGENANNCKLQTKDIDLIRFLWSQNMSPKLGDKIKLYTSIKNQINCSYSTFIAILAGKIWKNYKSAIS